MEGLKLDDFAGAVGQTWEVEFGGAAVPLRLDVAQELPRSTRPEGAFRLEWVGPGETYLPQAIYAFRGEGGAFDMFIVPIAKEGASLRYEAIFN